MPFSIQLLQRIPVKLVLTIAALLATSVLLIHGNPTIVGYVRFECLGGAESTDTVVSVQFHQKPGLIGRVDTANPAAGETTLSVQDSAFSANDFSTTPHYLLITSGTHKGRFFNITSNSASDIAIDTGSETLIGFSPSDSVMVIPHWTLDTLLPPASQTSVHESTGVLPSHRQTEIHFFDTTTNGIVLSPDRIYFVTASGWHQAEKNYPAAGDTVIEPGTAMVIRHAAGAADTQFYANSHVLQEDLAQAIEVDATAPRDKPLSMMRPVPVALSDLDLESVFAVSASTSPADRKDQLLVFETTSGAVNSMPSKTYFRIGGDWVLDDGATFPNSNSAEIPAGAAMVIRKSPNGTGVSQIWLNSPRY